MIPLLVICMHYLDYVVSSIKEHVVKELLKLHCIEFNGRKLVTGKAKTLPIKTTRKNKQAVLQTQSLAIALSHFHLFNE